MPRLLILAAALFCSLQAFAHTSSDDSHAKLRFAPSSLGFAEAVPQEYLRVVPGKVKGFASGSREERIMRMAFTVMEQVLNSEEFKEKVVNYVSSTGVRGYDSSNGLDNEGVYAFIMQGRELLGGDATPNEANFDLTRYYNFFSKVIGYTEPGKSNVIKANGKFYSKFNVAEVAGNLTHEWLHLMGFFHKSAASHDSVPYAVGYIMRDMVQRQMASLAAR